jgi:hypothetical protein
MIKVPCCTRPLRRCISVFFTADADGGFLPNDSWNVRSVKAPKADGRRFAGSKPGGYVKRSHWRRQVIDTGEVRERTAPKSWLPGKAR